MIAIIDYGVGNLRSVAKAFERVGASVAVTEKASVIEKSSHVVLPGVGAMKPAMDKLNELKLIPVINQVIKDKKSFLGICVGFQLLFERSEEGGDVPGLGILKGSVNRFTIGKVPQIGWNQLQLQLKACPLFNGVNDNAFVYFCHSYYVSGNDSRFTAATTSYGCSYTSAAWSDNVFGVQFHPEKSQSVGLKILENFSKVSV